MSAPNPLSYPDLRTLFPKLPETPVIVRAFDYARDHMSHSLFNHVARSWIFATKIAAARGDAFYAEVVAVATLLHDIGLAPLGDGPHRFEVNGAAIAAAFVRAQGFDDRRVQLVWDGIALHATHSISLFKETEVALSSRGITRDLGARCSRSRDPVASIFTEAAVPRLRTGRMQRRARNGIAPAMADRRQSHSSYALDVPLIPTSTLIRRAPHRVLGPESHFARMEVAGRGGDSAEPSFGAARGPDRNRLKLAENWAFFGGL